jgi:hypothetical protein
LRGKTGGKKFFDTDPSLVENIRPAPPPRPLGTDFLSSGMLILVISQSDLKQQPSSLLTHCIIGLEFPGHFLVGYDHIQAYCRQCCGSGMFIPDQTFFHPGST